MPYVCDVPSLHTAALPLYSNKIVETKQYESFNLDLQCHTVFYVHLWKLWTWGNVSHPLFTFFFSWKGSQVCQPEVRQHVCHGGRAAKICSSWNEWLTTTSSREEELISVISRLSSSLSARSSHLKVKHCSQIAEEVQLMTLLNGCSGDAHSSRHRTEELFENGTLAWKSNPGGTRDMAICRWDYGGHMWQRELMEFLWQMIPMWNTNRVLFPSSIQRAHEQRILFSRKCIISFCNTLDHSPQVTE